MNDLVRSGILEDVTEFAAKAHGTQLRKYTGEPYILHPIAVCGIVGEYTNDLPTLIGALLHDVLEDTTDDIERTKNEIREFLRGLSIKYKIDPAAFEIIVEKSLRIIIELTDVFTTEAYPNLNRKERKRREVLRMAIISIEAQNVKYADIIHNSPSIIENDKDFTPVFIEECSKKLDVMTDGNSVLRQLAIKSLL